MKVSQLDELSGQRIVVYLQDKDGMSHKYVGTVSSLNMKDELGNTFKLLKLEQVVKDNTTIVNDIQFSPKQMFDLRKWKVIS